MTPTEYIIANYLTKTTEEIAEHLGIKPKTVYCQVSRLRAKGVAIKCRTINHRLTCAILSNYRTMPMAQLADMMGYKNANCLHAHVAYLKTVGIVFPPLFHQANAKSKNMPVKPKRERAVRKETAPAGKVAKSRAEKVRRHIPNNERPPIEKTVICRVDKNPDQFTIKKDEGGKYVWDVEKRLWRLKKQLVA